MRTGGCHCGKVRFEVDGSVDEVVECNCSICTRKGYLHWIVPRSRFRLVAGEDVLTTYRFGSGVAQHHFCSHCGVASFYVPRSHPDGFSVNARCIDSPTVTGMKITPVDGKNWERHYPAGRGEYT